MSTKYILLSTITIFFIGCGQEAIQETITNNEQVSSTDFKSIQTSESFKWDSSKNLSLNVIVKENIVKKNIDGYTLTSYITAVENPIVTLGYQDTNITTLKANSTGEIFIETKLPTYINSINLFATSNGFTQKKEVSLSNIGNTQTILIERSPEPTQAELLEEGK